MIITMSIKYEIERTHSDFLCALCHSLLYVTPDGKDEICSNPKCVCFPVGTIFGDAAETVSPQLHSDMKQQKEDLIKRIEKTHGSSFTRFLYEMRLSLLEHFLKNGMLPSIGAFFTCNELLMLLNSIHHTANETDEEVFNNIFNDYDNYASELDFMEEVQNKRYLLSTKGESAYVLKYLRAVSVLRQNYGLTSKTASGLITDHLFKYNHIDSLAKKHIELKRGMDFGEFFDQMFSHIWALKYLLQMYYRIKVQFDYSTSIYDIAALLGLFLSLSAIENEKLTLIDDKWLKEHYNKHAKGQRSYEDFATEYVDGKEKSPIMVRLNDKIIVDRVTILFFVPYLVGLNKDKVPQQTVTGSERLKAKKQELGKIFEQHIRDITRNNDYKVPPDSVQIKYEYDVIGVSETNKRILLIDAKYRDFSPSAITGVNLIDHELLDEHAGLLLEVIRHQERLDYFLKHFDEFKEKIQTEGNLNDYKIKAIVVTKYPPLISKYRQVHVLDYDSFIKLLQDNKPD